MVVWAQIQEQLWLILSSPWLWVACLSGVTLGILWGALPGLSTTMAMTLLLGLTVGLSQQAAIMFMLGVYTGSVFGGAISAVLINIPGTPDAVPTMIRIENSLLRHRSCTASDSCNRIGLRGRKSFQRGWGCRCASSLIRPRVPPAWSRAICTAASPRPAALAIELIRTKASSSIATTPSMGAGPVSLLLTSELSRSNRCSTSVST